MKLKEFVEKYGDVEVSEELVNMIESGKRKIWMPEDGKTYYRFQTENYSSFCDDEVYDEDLKNILFRTFSFKTKEECEEYLEHLKTKTELQMWIAENDYIENHDDLYECYTFMPCSNTSMKLYIDECELMDAFEKFIFSSAEKCEEAIEAIGEDRIYRMLKYRRNWF